MDVRLRGPSLGALRRGGDHRTTVTFRDATLALPLHIHFVEIRDDETGETELRNVGVELGEELRDQEAAVQAPELTALALRQVVERYPHWLDLARAHALVPWEGPFLDEVKRAKRAKPARLDPDWYRMIAVEYRHHVEVGEPAPISAIARSHGVTPSAASRWVTTARKRNLIDGPEEAEK